MRLYAVTITRTILVAAPNEDAAWKVGEEWACPDPRDYEMADVDDVRGIDPEGAVLTMTPYVAGPYNTRSVVELIAAGEVEGD